MRLNINPETKSIWMYLFETEKKNLLSFSACNFVGFTPIFVAVATVVLIVLHVIQLRSLKTFLRKPGPHSSNYHDRPTHIFWRMVRFFKIIPKLVLCLAWYLINNIGINYRNKKYFIWKPQYSAFMCWKDKGVALSWGRHSG